KRIAVDGAAMVSGAGLALADILVRHVVADFGRRDERGARLLQNRCRVTHMIAMPVRQQHGGNAFGWPFPSLVPGGIAAQEGIDEDNSAFNLDSECRMTIPGYFHQSVPRLF